MSKITNDDLTRSGTEYFIAVPIMATVGVKGLIAETTWACLRAIPKRVGDKKNRLVLCCWPVDVVCNRRWTEAVLYSHSRAAHDPTRVNTNSFDIVYTCCANWSS